METATIRIRLESVKAPVAEPSDLFISFGIGKTKYFTKVTSDPSNGLFSLPFTKTTQIECVLNKSRTKIHTHKLRIRVGSVRTETQEREVLAEFEIDPADFFQKSKPDPRVYIIGQCELALGVAVNVDKPETPRRKPEAVPKRDEARRKAMNRCILRRKTKSRGQSGKNVEEDEDAVDVKFTPVNGNDPKFEDTFMAMFNLKPGDKERIMSGKRRHSNEVPIGALGIESPRPEYDASAMMSPRSDYQGSALVSPRSDYEGSSLVSPRSDYQGSALVSPRSWQDGMVSPRSEYDGSGAVSPRSGCQEEETSSDQVVRSSSSEKMLIDLSFQSQDEKDGASSGRAASDQIIDLLSMTMEPKTEQTNVEVQSPRFGLPNFNVEKKRTPFEPGENAFNPQRIRDIFSEEWMSCGDLDPGQPADTLFEEIKTVKQEDWPNFNSDIFIKLQTTGEIIEDDDDKLMFLASIHKLTYHIEEVIEYVPNDASLTEFHEKLTGLLKEDQQELLSRNSASIVADIEECLRSDPSGFDFQVAVTDLVQKRLIFESAKPYSQYLWQYLVQYADEELANRFVDDPPTDLAQMQSVLVLMINGTGIEFSRAEQSIMFLANVGSIASGDKEPSSLCPDLPPSFLVALCDAFEPKVPMPPNIRDRIRASSTSQSKFIHQGFDLTVPSSLWDY